MKTNYQSAINSMEHIVDLWLPWKIKYDKTSGIAIGMVYAGQAKFTKSFGFGNVESKRVLDENSLFQLASISKTFTTVAILQLQEKKKLKITDKVVKHLPWLAEGTHKELKNITIKALLSHTSKVFRDGVTGHWSTGVFPEDLKKDIAANVGVVKDAKYKYSNLGFAILGAVIESVSGVSYREYIQKNIFDVLKMKRSYTDYETGISLVTGYGREIPGLDKEFFVPYKTNAYAPATGLISCVSDMQKFIISLSFISKKTPQILSLESKKLLSRFKTKTEEGDHYGFGLHIHSLSKKTVVGHSGGFMGFNTQFLIDQKTGLGVIVLTNAIRGSAHFMAKGIMEGMYRLVDQPERFKSKTKINSAEFEGLYRNWWGDALVVSVGNILIDMSPETSFPLKFSTYLIPKKEKNQFLMKPYSVFDSHGETAKFEDFINRKAQRLILGSSPLKRVE